MKKYLFALFLVSVSTTALAGVSLTPYLQINFTNGNGNINGNLALGTVPDGTDYFYVQDRGNTINVSGVNKAGYSFFCSVGYWESQFEKVAQIVRAADANTTVRVYASGYRCTDAYTIKDSRYSS